MKKLLLGLLSCLMLCYAINGYSYNKLIGTIKGNTYSDQITSKKGYGKFSVEIPQYYKGIDYNTVRMGDCRVEWESCVHFGQSDRDFSYYRVSISPKGEIPLTEAKDKLFDSYIDVANKIYGGNAKKIYSKDVKFRGYPAYYRVYTQSSPGVKLKPNKTFYHKEPVINRMSEKQTYTHAMLLVDYKDYVLLFWFQGTDLEAATAPYAITENNREGIIDMTWAPWKNFMNSLEITK